MRQRFYVKFGPPIVGAPTWRRCRCTTQARSPPGGRAYPGTCCRDGTFQIVSCHLALAPLQHMQRTICTTKAARIQRAAGMWPNLAQAMHMVCGHAPARMSVIILLQQLHMLGKVRKCTWVPTASTAVGCVLFDRCAHGSAAHT